MKQITFLLLLFLLIDCTPKTSPQQNSSSEQMASSSDQLTYWQYISSNDQTFWKLPYGPADSFYVYTLDISSIRALLSKAKLISESETLIDNVVLIPAPDRNLMPFKFFKSSVLSPEMEKKFPNIRSYIIQDMKDNAIQGRVDLNDKGFRALIFWHQNTWIIDPANPEDSVQHVAYFREHLPTKKNQTPFEVSDTINHK